MKYRMLPMTAAEVRYDAGRYLRAKNLLDELRKCREWIGTEKYEELRTQALTGDVDGATKALGVLMNSRW